MYAFLLSINGALSVALGAMGKHMLESSLSVASLKTFSTAVDYHQLYSIFILILYCIHVLNPNIIQRSVIIFFLIGMLLFSGSLYAYIFTSWTFLVYITPIGGLLLMLSWLRTGYCLYRYTN